MDVFNIINEHYPIYFDKLEKLRDGGSTSMEIFGNDCLSDLELDDQLDWLYKWREQCAREEM